MSKSVSTLTPLDGVQTSGGGPAVDSQEEAGEATGSECTCSKCGLYRWYPPLLLLSTIMSGVFCWMYVTKPVFLTQPREADQPGAQPAVQEAEPGRVSDDPNPPTAGGASSLDPAVAGLPGESLPGEGLMLLSPAGAGSGTPGDALEPIVVRRKGPPLFKPFLVGDLDVDQSAAPDPGAGEGETAAPAEDSALKEREAGSSAEVEEFGPPREAAPQVPPRSDEPGYRVRPSFMAEFLDSSGPLSPDETKLSQSDISNRR